MAGIANFHGKKAAPFTKGGRRSKTHPNDAKGRKRKAALKVLKKAKGEPDSDDLSNVDLAFHFRHGWIPINPGEEDKTATGAEGHTIKIKHKDGHESLYRATSQHNKAGLAKYENLTGDAQSKTVGEMGAHLRKLRAAGATFEHGVGSKLGNAQKAMSNAYGKSPSLSRGAGSDIDLDWSQWDAGHKGAKNTAGAKNTRAVVKSGKKTGVSFNEIKAFKRSVPGASGDGTLGPKAQAALQARAGMSFHYRAKAILAAQRGDTKAAAKFQALHVARMARNKAGGGKGAPSAPKARGVSHPSMVAHRFTKASAPKGSGRPARVPAAQRARAMNIAAHAAAVRASRA